MRYIHQDNIHNFSAPRQVVPEIMKLLQPNSVVDVGCGTGTWLKIFQEFGVQEILGIDGDYVDLSLLKIDRNFFKSFDLEKELKLESKFDLAISLEVAEHLKYESSDIFVKSLCELSETIIFSAAIINQGGQNHINEQNPQFWIDIFQKNGYQILDILRPIFWDNKEIDFWYRQNILLFTKNSNVVNKLSKMPNFLGKNLVHPIGFIGRDKMAKNLKNENQNIINGHKGLKFYIKLLVNYLKNKFSNV